MYFVKHTVKKTLETVSSNGTIKKRNGRRHRSKSPVRLRGSHDSRPINENEGYISCSKLYSKEFILQEMQRIASDSKITNLQIEDLLERNDLELIKATRTLLVEAMFQEGLHGQTLQGHAIVSQRRKNLPNCQERIWDSIVFLNCVSTASKYHQHTIQKRQFQLDLKRMLNLQQLTFVLPIRFKTQLEIFEGTTLFDIVQLLQEVERDVNISQVEFPDLDLAATNHQSQIAQHFARQISPKTLAWTGAPGRMTLRYHQQDMNVVSVIQDPCLHVLREIQKALERVLYQSSQQSVAKFLSTRSLLLEQESVRSNDHHRKKGGAAYPLPPTMLRDPPPTQKGKNQVGTASITTPHPQQQQQKHENSDYPMSAKKRNNNANAQSGMKPKQQAKQNGHKHHDRHNHDHRNHHRHHHHTVRIAAAPLPKNKKEPLMILREEDDTDHDHDSDKDKDINSITIHDNHDNTFQENKGPVSPPVVTPTNTMAPSLLEVGHKEGLSPPPTTTSSSSRDPPGTKAR